MQGMLSVRHGIYGSQGVKEDGACSKLGTLSVQLRVRVATAADLCVVFLPPGEILILNCFLSHMLIAINFSSLYYFNQDIIQQLGAVFIVPHTLQPSMHDFSLRSCTTGFLTTIHFILKSLEFHAFQLLHLLNLEFIAGGGLTWPVYFCFGRSVFFLWTALLIDALVFSCKL